MDRDVGIEAYLTSTPGLGGTLKATADDFVVEEISSPPPPAIDGSYTIAALRVRNWETNRLVRELARGLHISRRRIGFAGTKDKRPLTTHLFSFENVPPEAIKALRMEDVDAYVANPIEGEGTESYEVRAALRDTGDVHAALRSYPKSYGFEKAILNHLAARPGDYVGALQQLPFNLLLMFVHGYQSYLFNQILSERMRRAIPIHEPVAGDIVLPADKCGLPDRDRTIDVTCDNLERVRDRCREGKAWVSAVLFGSESEFAAGEVGQIEKGVVAKEGLRAEDFIIPEIPRISSKGSRREILAPLHDLAVTLADNSLNLSFASTRGSYATCLVREFTKTE